MRHRQHVLRNNVELLLDTWVAEKTVFMKQVSVLENPAQLPVH